MEMKTRVGQTIGFRRLPCSGQTTKKKQKPIVCPTLTNLPGVV